MIRAEWEMMVHFDGRTMTLKKQGIVRVQFEDGDIDAGRPRRIADVQGG